MLITSPVARLAVACGLFFVAVVCFAQAKDRQVTLAIDIPVVRPSTSHLVIQYRLFDDGSAYHVRYVPDWAYQASVSKQLTKDEIARVRALLAQLPRRVETVAKDRSAVITLHGKGKKVETIVYDRTKLPHAMQELLVILGGIRFELTGNVKFLPEQQLLTIEIPRTDGDVCHYEVFKTGFSYDFRANGSFGWQSERYRYLEKEALAKVKTRLATLPAGVANVPRTQSVIVTTYEKGKAKTTVYDRAKLPAQLKELFDLIGGLRDDLKDKVTFLPKE